MPRKILVLTLVAIGLAVAATSVALNLFPLRGFSKSTLSESANASTPMERK